MAVDYEELATKGMSADQLAVIFLKEYFRDEEISYPINPFQILTDLGIPFILRPFEKYDGIYIPAVNEDDSLPLSKYIEKVVQIHHRLTIIHAFRDGNGRTTRAFANMMLLKRHVSPVFF